MNQEILRICKAIPRSKVLGIGGRFGGVSTGWLIAATLFSSRLFPFITQQGMFFDGVTYAAISRNLAWGVGDMWHLVFTRGAVFSEHPPLAFVLESYFFRVFGDHFWVEKLYSALTGLATAVGMALIWRRLVGRRSVDSTYAWLPIAIWLIIPAWSWIYQNNMLENTVGMFATLAVYAALCAVDSPAGGFKWIMLAAIGVTAALFSKGPVGLYPLITPIVAGITLRSSTFGHTLRVNAVYLMLFVFLVALVLMTDGAFDSFSRYLRQQVVASVTGQREVTGSLLGRIAIVWNMVSQLILPAIAAGTCVWIDYIRRLKSSGIWQSSMSRPVTGVFDTTANKRAILFCLATAASASFPIMLSPKQFPHYAFPSYAFYALALALWSYPALKHRMLVGSPAIISRMNCCCRLACVVTLLLIMGTTVVLAGSAHRDPKILHDSIALGKVLPAGSSVGFHKRNGDQELELNSNDFSLQSYLSRFQGIALYRNRTPCGYLLTPANQSQLPAGCASVPTEMIAFRLYQRLPSADSSSEAAPFIGTQSIAGGN